MTAASPEKIAGRRFLPCWRNAFFLRGSHIMEARPHSGEDNNPPNFKVFPYDALNVGLGDIGKITYVDCLLRKLLVNFLLTHDPSSGKKETVPFIHCSSSPKEETTAQALPDLHLPGRKKLRPQTLIVICST
ncbi:hypothetical protein KSP40_PGU000411 [Platanthera guangdongensis]|uniref:Uncharacterized protein n=1 Tax=Platanthera guangdongensis TaxID=2320717 RepID=A0ABR2M4C8_9ASPA